MNYKIMTWAEARRLTNWATQAPLIFKIFKLKHIIAINLSVPRIFFTSQLTTFLGLSCLHVSSRYYGWEQVFSKKSIQLHVVVQFSLHHLLKRLFLFHWIFFPALSKISWPFVCGSIWGSLFYSTDLSVCSCASTILPWWLQLCNTAWSLGLWCLLFWFSFSRLLWLFGVFSGSIQILGLFLLALRRIMVSFWQELHWICRLFG